MYSRFTTPVQGLAVGQSALDSGTGLPQLDLAWVLVGSSWCPPQIVQAASAPHGPMPWCCCHAPLCMKHTHRIASRPVVAWQPLAACGRPCMVALHSKLAQWQTIWNMDHILQLGDEATMWLAYFVGRAGHSLVCIACVHQHARVWNPAVLQAGITMYAACCTCW